MKNFSYSLFFQALNNGGRLLIVELLKQGPKTVQEISSKLGMEQSLVSHNLKCLTNCGFVNVERKGNYRVYSLDKKIVLPMLNLIDRHIEKFEERLKACGIINPKKEVAYAKV